MSDEDAYLNRLLDSATDFEVEVHYNHYGQRGVVDALIYAESDHPPRCIEVKSECAIKNSTGANEILRQFNKMCEYFYEGANRQFSSLPNYELHILDSKATRRHLAENLKLYEGAVRNRRVLGSGRFVYLCDLDSATSAPIQSISEGHLFDDGDLQITTVGQSPLPKQAKISAYL